MNELILHIGMHKTGSTSIQSCLDKFDNGTTRYAQLCDVNHSIPLYTLFSENRYSYAVHTSLGLTDAEIDQLTQQIRQNLDCELALKRQTLIISGEDISLIEPEGIKAMAEYLKTRVQRIRVLAYIRDPVGFASSALQQYIQGGLRIPLIPAPEYIDRFRKFVDSFGRDSVEFVKFDRLVLHGGSVVADFCHRAGIDNQASTDEHSNSSISFACMQLIYLFNNYGLPFSGNAVLARTRLVFMYRLSLALQDTGFKMPLEWVSRSVDMDDISWMENVSGLQLMDVDEFASEVTDNAEDPLQSLQQMLTTVDEATIEKLKQQIELIDCNFTRSDDLPSLLNVLFLSAYFETAAEMTTPVADTTASDALRPCESVEPGAGTTPPSQLIDEIHLSYPAWTPWTNVDKAA
jgi:hypothetical protein